MQNSSPVTAVTGGSRGIGAAVVRRLAAGGHHVVIGYRDDVDAAAQVAADVQALGREAVIAAVDVTDPRSFDAFFGEAQDLGPLTGVVAAAGAVRGVGRLLDLDPSDVKQDLEVNLLGAVLTSRAAVHHLARGAGSLARRSTVTVGCLSRQYGESLARGPRIHEEQPLNFFNAKHPVTVIVLGVVFAGCGVFYGLSPSESGSRPAQQIIIAVVLVLIGLLFVVQGVGSKRR